MLLILHSLSFHLVLGFIKLQLIHKIFSLSLLQVPRADQQRLVGLILLPIPAQLCDQWCKRQRELKDLYEINRMANSGWKGLVLSLLGIHLPDKRTVFLGGKSSGGDALYSHHAQLGRTSGGMPEHGSKK
jgi:hypothetical protein